MKASLEQSTREAVAQAEHEKALAEYFIRTEPIGFDRDFNAYWCFENNPRLWVQSFNRSEPTSVCGESYLNSKPSLVSCTWAAYENIADVWLLVDALDERGVREKALKSALRIQFSVNTKSIDGVTYKVTGSEYLGKSVKRTFRKVTPLFLLAHIYIYLYVCRLKTCLLIFSFCIFPFV
jgi:hypothetical protein